MSFTLDDEQKGEKALGDGVSNEASEDRREPATSSRRAFCKLLIALSAVTGYELLSAGSQPLEAAPPSKAHNTDGHSGGKGKKTPSKQHMRHTDLHSDTRKQKAHGPHKDTPHQDQHHNDKPSVHSDTPAKTGEGGYVPHQDSYPIPHTDIEHKDINHVDSGFTDNHTDTTYYLPHQSPETHPKRQPRNPKR